MEVDPFDPTSTPRKHTALGRFKHEGANVTIAASGHAVSYSGDDERFDYLYKFVSKGKYREGDKKHNMTLLTEGDLFVASFKGNSPKNQIDGSGVLPSDGAFDGTGQWIQLTRDGKSLVPGMGIDQVLVYTRLAADAMGATKMDRPEDVEINPATGKIYMACTNNTSRTRAQVDEPNPRANNRHGHIVEMTETGDQTSTEFTWSVILVAGDPAVDESVYFSGYPADQVQPISCPDNLAFDSAGNLWVSTDGQPGTIQRNDALFRVTLEGRDRGKVEQFMAVPDRCRNLRTADSRRRRAGFRRGPAPGRGRQLGRAALAVPGLRPGRPPRQAWRRGAAAPGRDPDVQGQERAREALAAHSNAAAA